MERIVYRTVIVYNAKVFRSGTCQCKGYLTYFFKVIELLIVIKIYFLL